RKRCSRSSSSPTTRSVNAWGLSPFRRPRGRPIDRPAPRKPEEPDLAIEQDKAEIQQRVCRACNSTYKYPVLRSLATRFYCADCMELPERVRAAFEQFNKRIKNLTATVEKLE